MDLGSKIKNFLAQAGQVVTNVGNTIGKAAAPLMNSGLIGIGPTPSPVNLSTPIYQYGKSLVNSVVNAAKPLGVSLGQTIAQPYTVPIYKQANDEILNAQKNLITKASQISDPIKKKQLLDLSTQIGKTGQDVAGSQMPTYSNKDIAISGAKTAGTILAGEALKNPLTYAFPTAFSLMNKDKSKTLAEKAGEMTGETLPFVGLANEVTTPIAKAGVQKFAPELVGSGGNLAVRAGKGAVNVAENTALNAATGQPLLQNAPIAFAQGAAMGNFEPAGKVSKAVEFKNPMAEQDVKDTLKAVDNVFSKDPQVAIEQGAKSETFLRQMAHDYIDPKFAAKAPIKDVANELVNRINVDKSYDLAGLNLVSKSGPKTPIVEPTNVAPETNVQPVQTEPLPAESGVYSPVSSKYVDNSPLKFNLGDNLKANAQDIRSEYAGAKNSQALVANQLADEVRSLIPDQTQREALTLFRDTGGDTTKLQTALSDPNFAAYKPQLEAALNPTPQMVQASKMLDQYYQETGQAGMQHGFLNELRDNYVNRIYQPDNPINGVQTEAARTGLPQSTSHGKERIYDTLIDAINGGKKPATLDSADLLNIHGTEFAKVLTNNKLFEGLQAAGLGSKFEDGKIPAGYQKIGNSNFGIPDYLATGLKAITEPNFINKIDELRGIKRYQGFVKTMDLSVSLFHHFTMAMQTLYQTKFGLELPKFASFAKNADFNSVEQDAVRNGLMTTNVDANKEVLSNLNQKGDFIDKLMSLPGFKQYEGLIKTNNEFLFGKFQPWLKTMDYGMKVSDWIGKNPGASDEAITAAKRGFAREANAAYGGLNWESLGVTPTFQGIMRLGLLAPDWTYSNVDLAKLAFSGGTGGAAARSHLVSALIGGAIVTEGLNKLITGHFTDQNTKGHETEVEVRPGVYMSFFRGGIGDLLKLASNVKDNGLIQGSARFTGGKLAALPRTAVTLLSGVDYNGNQLAPPGATNIEKDLRYAGALAQAGGPIPFGATNVVKMASKAVKDPLAYGLVGTGLARYGTPSTPENLSKQNYFDALDKEMTNLNPKEQAAMKSIPVSDPANPQANITKYNDLLYYPNVFNARKNIAITQAGGDTTKVDPLYTVPHTDAIAYMRYESMYPGPQKSQFYTANPVVGQIGALRSTYYQNNPILDANGQPISQASSGAPIASPYVQAQMNAKNWKDPRVQSYLNANTAFKNQTLATLGMGPLTTGGGSGSTGPFKPYMNLGFGLRANAKGKIQSPVTNMKKVIAKLGKPGKTPKMAGLKLKSMPAVKSLTYKLPKTKGYKGISAKKGLKLALLKQTPIYKPKLMA